MIDDTPQVKWSNAWWEKVFFGVLVPPALLGLLAYCFFNEKAYTIGLLRYRAIQIFPVYGLQANLMLISYLCLAVAAFSYGYARHHPIMCLYYDKVQAISLVIAVVSISWCSILFLQ